jgi:DNA-binding response OmpR family regulator
MLNHTILLAEDDHHLGALLVEYLEGEGFVVKLCKDGESALKYFQQYQADLCLLDVMLPLLDGFTLAKQIRLSNPTVPIIFLTAKSLKDDKLMGYNLGADDYITKPFDADELVWKIKALLRRKTEPVLGAKAEPVSIGKYTFDFVNQSLTLYGSTKRVTERENEILNYLSTHRNTIIKREELLKALWGDDDYFLGRSLDVFITKIRKYLKEDDSLSIENIFGVGFIFNVPE